MSNKILTIGVLVAIVIAIAGLFFPKVGVKAGAAITDVQNTVSSGLTTAQLFLASNGVGIGQVATNGNCTSSGTSTLFAVANPFNATSTVTLQSVSGIGQATTSSFLIGTSTKSTGLAATDVSPTLGNFSVSTTTPFFTSGGILVGSAGYLSPGANTFRTIVVGPSDFVVGQATSTATGAGAGQYAPGFACSYKFLWTN